MAATSPPAPPQETYIHSPLHYAVARRDHSSLSRLLLSLPLLPHPSTVLTESDSTAAELISDKISAVLDRRDVPSGETPLHLTVRFNDVFSAAAIAAAGADISLQNTAGWSPLQEALAGRKTAIAAVLLKAHRSSAWSKWRRRLPRVVAGLRRMRDFYMEISFHFDSSFVPFIGKLAPSETIKIWKRGGNIRADTTVAGVDGLRLRRASQSFVFLGDGDGGRSLPSGSLLILDHQNRRISEVAGAPMSDGDVAGFCEQSGVYRPGMDVTKAEVVGKTNWRRKERVEVVAEWKSRVYDVHNVVFSFRSRKSPSDLDEEVTPLELEEDEEEGFLVAEYPPTQVRRRHSSFVGEEEGSDGAGVGDLRRNWSEKKKRGDVGGRKSVEMGGRVAPVGERRRRRNTWQREKKITDVGEKEYVKRLRPCVWLTEEFPLKTEEILPLLDLLSKKIKAVRRLRELLTAKFPPGTFPVKVAIPVVPGVRGVVTFTKFVEVGEEELFFTPPSSPRRLWEEDKVMDVKKERKERGEEDGGGGDPFAIPKGYSWWSTQGDNRMTKSKSVRK